jgi:hypothetical protein
MTMSSKSPLYFYKVISSLFLSLYFFLPISAYAQATLFITPTAGNYKVGEDFSVLVNLNTGGKDINVASVKINFDNTRLEVKDVGYSRSIFTIWTEEPKFSNPAGVISFSGGLPSPGFNGPSGAILRVTFTTKASGKAPVIFSTGYVLANDGTGTNILDGLEGATFNIGGTVEVKQPGKPSQPQGTISVPVSNSYERTLKPISAPVFALENSKQIEEGDLITVKGLALPSSKVIFYLQKDYEDPTNEEGFSGPDGTFAHTYSKKTVSGIYRVWGRNLASDGVISDASEPINVAVVKPLVFRIGSLALSYFSIIVALFSILLVAIILFIFWWVKRRKELEKQGVEISEAEIALHDGFDKLKMGFEKYVDYKGRKTKVKRELKDEMESIEQEIGKEIEDIKNQD